MAPHCPLLQPEQLCLRLYTDRDLLRFRRRGVPGNGRPSAVGLSRLTSSSAVLSFSARFFSHFPIRLLPFSLNMSKKYSLPRPHLQQPQPTSVWLWHRPPPPPYPIHSCATKSILLPVLLVTSVFLMTSPLGALTLSPLGSPPAPLAVWSSD